MRSDLHEAGRAGSDGDAAPIARPRSTPKREEKPGLAEIIAPPPEDKPPLAMITTTPGKARIVLLTLMAVIIVIAALKLAAAVIVPIALAIVVSIVLSPLVVWLNRLRIPTAVGAAIIVAGLVATSVVGVYYLSYPAAAWMRTLPDTIREIEWKLRDIRAPIEEVTAASEQVEEIAASDDGATPVVEVREESMADVLLSGTQAFLITASIVLVLVYMLLASGDLFLQKLVRLQPQFSDKKVAVEVVRQIKHDVALHLFTITLINIGLGVVTTVAMWMLGLPNALLWGIVAAALNYIPYLGSLAGTVIIGLVSFVTFHEPLQILVPPLVYMLITSIEGYIITPMVLGVRLSLNPVIIVAGLIFWGWLWGIPGALLTVPMLVIIKSVCDRITGLQAVGEFLGR